MSHRFCFFAERLSEQEWVVNDPAELHHLHKVVRLDVGAAVDLLDGAKFLARGVIQNKTPAAVHVRVEEEKSAEPLLGRSRLCLGVLKRQTFDELLPSLVELGIEEIWLFAQDGTERFAWNTAAEERWQKITREAQKQCRRITGMAIRTFGSLALLAEELRKTSDEVAVLVPGANQRFMDWAQHDTGKPKSVVIGSEKGLTEAELDILQRLASTPLSLGNTVLRAYTAAIAAASVLQQARL